MLHGVKDGEGEKREEEGEVVEVALGGKVEKRQGVRTGDVEDAARSAGEALPLLGGEDDHLAEEDGDDGEVDPFQTDEGEADQGCDEGDEDPRLKKAAHDEKPSFMTRSAET